MKNFRDAIRQWISGEIDNLLTFQQPAIVNLFLEGCAGIFDFW
jgi:hypothetical protein